MGIPCKNPRLPRRWGACANTIIATDMERMATSRVAMTGNGVFLLPIETARGFASRMPADAEISIEVDGLLAKLSCGRSRATMELFPVDDFPVMRSDGKGESFTVDGAAFVSMLARVISG